MEPDFWHQRWERREIGFHEGQSNSLLVAHFDKLNLPKGARVFLPLCGKTRDIAWLLDQGYRVVGAELSALAINELFEELGLKPEVVTAGTAQHYRANNIDIFVGDIFDMNARQLGPVNAIYDRAAMVALPADTRQTYARHLMSLTDAAPQLLITFEYDQLQMEGPPFSVTGDELKQFYDTTYEMEAVERRNIEGGMKGKVAAVETAWLLGYS